MKYSRGFTLIELMVIIVLVAILAAYSVSGFQNLIMKNRVSAHTSALLADLNFARSEAITRGRDIAMVSSGASLADGWSIVDDVSASAPAVLRVRNEPLARVSITETAEKISGKVKIVFNRQGQANQDNVLTVKAEDCPSGLNGGQRKIEIREVGRVGVSSGDRICP
jgi:type IV fimbrial biogenesis protein FimT